MRPTLVSVGIRIVFSLAVVGLGACAGGDIMTTGTDPQPGEQPTDVQLTSSGVSNTFNHDTDQRDPFELLKEHQDEGAPTVSTRLHSCHKISYTALGHLLTSRGVDLAKKGSGGLPSAGELYAGGSQALGAPNYAARTSEPSDITTAGATKLMDVFIQAAPEIIAAMPSLDACKLGGQPPAMFDTDGYCTQQGVSCLIGAPAGAQHVALCKQLIDSASSPTVGQRMAVAAILAAAHTCE